MGEGGGGLPLVARRGPERDDALIASVLPGVVTRAGRSGEGWTPGVSTAARLDRPPGDAAGRHQHGDAGEGANIEKRSGPGAGPQPRSGRSPGRVGAP